MVRPKKSRPRPAGDEEATIAELRRAVQAFVDERDWRQFHTPKNLAMSLAIEAAELMEHFQWLDVAESMARGRDPSCRDQIAEEIADVCCYLLSLVNALELDLSRAVRAKLVKNARKYPADEFRGKSGR
jgi:NTP pyrophosphatase (non-canonical NTP hydrolase)